MSIKENQQRVFDEVLAHLRKQGCMSNGESGSCAYRGEDGTKCAFGPYISDEKYTRKLEGKSIDNVEILEILPEYVKSAGRDFNTFVQSRMHDALDDENFHLELESQAQCVAEKFGLVYNPPETVSQ